MSDVGAIGVILSNYREMLKHMHKKYHIREYEYGILLIDLIIKDIEKQGIDLNLGE